MIKALSLAAALALLPLSASVAHEVRGPAEDALEAAAEAFEARMEEFGKRAEAISEDKSLTDNQKEARIAVLWNTEYQGDVEAFTRLATEHAGDIAAEALAEVDVEAVVAEAMAEAQVEAEAEIAGAVASAQGMAVNGAWASNDPEHMATYGLVAEYAAGEALDALDEIDAELDVDVDVDVDAEDVAPATAPAAPQN